MLTIVRKVLGMTPEPVTAFSQPDRQSLKVSRHGFSANARSGQSVSLDWKDVMRIFAFRRDRGASDLVCLEFEDREGRRLVIHEDMEEFMGVARRMRTEFPSIPKDWYLTAMQPGIGQELYKRVN